jgi:hypothetical protein
MPILAPRCLRVVHGKAERLRDIRKYAVGDLKDASFWCRGPNHIHNLSAYIPNLFCHIGRGIDQDTWLFHLHSRWIRDTVKDDELAKSVQQIERNDDLSPQDTRD